MAQGLESAGCGHLHKDYNALLAALLVTEDPWLPLWGLLLLHYLISQA